ncbi:MULTISPECIES: rod shape-determining protein MreD [unclassified Lactobacillus]|uniref:rod shape-determining protein MreD n=1 Tax=unclassified Lactobacillus TaxID=2620435 RepID=UPI00226A51E7|nr:MULTISPECIES: rod shape-determining protein MreD [unclassified Lactobacillus]MCX8721197.1 rod shape-determining protein MreD [Lactobacillus sp. B4010]MCX8722700.1 rod shape-determining protein MreD [Lactobacillus sp. B4005]MCX8731975.1 rod shape-determining protein MreD [Lactobacillus sp. B4015]MCX8734338.1 rod shape-determining protein MreD [Lactobacillus sp. B4012]
MRSLQKYTLALGLILALALNGSLSLYLHPFFNLGANQLMPIGMMLIALFDDTNSYELWLAAGAGIVSDIYFYGVLGLYSVCLPCVCLLLQKSARFFPEVFWVRLIAVLLSTVLINSYNWLVLNLMGISNISVSALLGSFLPTIGWSFVFILITYRVWGMLANNFPFMVKLENYQN